MSIRERSCGEYLMLRTVRHTHVVRCCSGRSRIRGKRRIIQSQDGCDSNREYVCNVRIGEKGTRFRQSVPVKVRMAITLRFLATGYSYTSLQYLFKISKQRISKIVPETCKALMKVLRQYITASAKAREDSKIRKIYCVQRSRLNRRACEYTGYKDCVGNIPPSSGMSSRSLAWLQRNLPCTPEEWSSVSQQFQEMWGFPH
ncbi:hypothetical protein PR048_017934 [Dryococelus australis]|uniref:Uncharacterized protein n=1 Tax=Dryococelus australis TaxID=614101 RepID=A0ABQ9HBH0_9NEOP|nr:hypothetical protein PR048_017934 [Dryococelus australis]